MTHAKGVIKWSLYLLGLLAIGPAASLPIAALRDVSGGSEATALVGSSITAGILSLVAPLAAALGLGVLTSRLIGPRPGLIAAGLVLAWAALRSGNLDGVFRATRDGGTIIPLAIEGGVLGLLGVLVGAMVWAAGRDHHAPSGAAPALGRVPAEALGLISEGVRRAPASIVASIVAGGIVVWLVAQEPLKGQTIAATVLAGIAAGGFARAVSSRAHPASPVPALLGMAVLGVIGPLSVLVVGSGGSRLVSDVLLGDVFALALPMPLDWVAGACWGIPMGLAWAESMVDKHEPQEARAA